MLITKAFLPQTYRTLQKGKLVKRNKARDFVSDNSVHELAVTVTNIDIALRLLFSFSVPVNFSLAFHNCKRNLIARSENGDSSEIVRRHVLLERRYLLFSGDIFFWFYTKESGIIT